MSDAEATPLAAAFGTIGELVRLHAASRPRRAALVQSGRSVDYAELDRMMDRVAAALRRRGVAPRECIAIHATNSIDYALFFLGALRAGVAAALIPPTVTPQAAAAMIRDSGARLVFTDEHAAGDFAHDESGRFEAAIEPGDPFNIIYSSGTTGEPKGIVQPHSMRWAHMQRALAYGYDAEAITLLTTPLYSNTTLVSFFPTLAGGGTVVLGPKFEPAAYLATAQRERVTHTMLVPVQYQRLMAHADFGRYDLGAFRMKLSTSAHFPAALKRQVLERWPGELVEYYGMTEGGATCVLWASRHPDKLHTVGPPAAGVVVRLIDESGCEVAAGEAGEVVGHSAAMMTGYHNRPEDTLRAEWRDGEGRRYIRTGDIGRFDADGFLTLVDRKKDVIISGGFNIYPSDLEAVLRSHPDVADVAVAGVASERWGETPVAWVVLRQGAAPGPEALLAWANERLGKTQRLAAVRFIDALPRSPIGKVLKRSLAGGLRL